MIREARAEGEPCQGTIEGEKLLYISLQGSLWPSDAFMFLGMCQHRDANLRLCSFIYEIKLSTRTATAGSAGIIALYLIFLNTQTQKADPGWLYLTVCHNHSGNQIKLSLHFWYEIYFYNPEL